MLKLVEIEKGYSNGKDSSMAGYFNNYVEFKYFQPPFSSAVF